MLSQPSKHVLVIFLFIYRRACDPEMKAVNTEVCLDQFA